MRKAYEVCHLDGQGLLSLLRLPRAPTSHKDRSLAGHTLIPLGALLGFQGERDRSPPPGETDIQSVCVWREYVDCVCVECMCVEGMCT